jgi:hypothetical protein
MRRVDMHDDTGTNFCGECADDADLSGVFGISTPVKERA